MALTGGCLCGDITYEISDCSTAAVLCHCSSCQHVSGSAFSVNLMIPKTNVTVNGVLSVYEQIADSGGVVYRKFCGRCGSSVLSELENLPDLVALKVGTLDSHEDIEPESQHWCDHKQNWVNFEDNLTSLPKGAF